MIYGIQAINLTRKVTPNVSTHAGTAIVFLLEQYFASCLHPRDQSHPDVASVGMIQALLLYVCRLLLYVCRAGLLAGYQINFASLAIMVYA